MWWLDPGKEVLSALFNRILAPYVLNLDMNQVNYGIGQGQVTFHKLQLKKGALDKFRLPVDVVEGHLGKFTLSLHWMNLGNQPVEIIVEDMYLLVVPSPPVDVDLEEEENRIQAAKMERLESSELFHMSGQPAISNEDSQKSPGLLSSLITKVVNNLQVTVKNIHIRYEDRLSVSSHPFAAGITLAEFTVISTDENWKAAFIDSTAGAVHKLAKLQSLAAYFDTDSSTMVGLSHAELVERFSALISKENNKSDHQFVLKPVSGEGRIVVNHKLDKNTPKFDIELLFDEIGILLDNHQYRDVISLIDMYHFYTRQYQYRHYRPSSEELQANKAQALFRFAGTAILNEVRERRYKWTWAHFAQRRNDRHQYVDLFKAKILDSATPSDLDTLRALDRKLTYQDISFYRSIARSHARKDMVSKQRLKQKTQQRQGSGSWTSWLWGSSEEQKPPEDPVFTGEMTEEQRQQLYEVLDYDERAALVESFQAPRDAVKLKLTSKLDKGSFALRTDPHGSGSEILSLAFDLFVAEFVQRPDSFDASISLGGFAVYDGTTKDTLYPQIVHVKESQRIGVTSGGERLGQDEVNSANPFFYAKFESNPLDERADNALTVRMRHMEVIYHKGYVEAIYKFFKPPDSQLESVEALLGVASQTLEGIRKETRAGLENALEKHKTIDVQMDLDAPLIIVPETITTTKCKHLLVDAGHIAIESNLADKDMTRQIRLKRHQRYNEEDYRRLESMMYDKFLLRLESAQFVIGNDLQACRDALVPGKHDSLHLLERININLELQNSIVPAAYSLARFKVSADLPTLQVNMSDEKYKSLIRLIDISIPIFDRDNPHDTPALSLATQNHYNTRTVNFPLPAGLFGPKEASYTIDDEDDGQGNEHVVKHSEDQFFEVEEGYGSKRLQLQQHIFELDVHVSSLRAALSKSSFDGKDRKLGDVTFEDFSLAFALAKFDMSVDVHLRSLSMNICQPSMDTVEFMSSTESDSKDGDLLIVKYKRVQKTSPLYESDFEGIDQSVDVQISTFVFHVAPEPILTLYDFIMTTFVPKPGPTAQTAVITNLDDSNTGTVAQSSVRPENGSSAQKIRVTVVLASVQVVLLNDNVRIGTISLSTANAALLLRADTTSIRVRLGSLSFVDDSDIETVSPEFKHIMSIEGNDFADFAYQTFDPSEDGYPGINSKVRLSTGSIRFNLLEQPLHDIFLFITKLTRLKGVYDAATQVAAQRASGIEKMQFDITIKTPIIVFPTDAVKSLDKLTMRLGEFVARNSYENTANKITASLHGIQLSSEFQDGEKLSTLKMIDDINITADIVQTSGINRSDDSDYPDVQVAVEISDVKVHLTQVQFIVLLNLSHSILHVLEGAPQGAAQVEEATSSGALTGPRLSEISPSPSADLQPELRGSSSAEGIKSWTTLDLVVAVGAIKLHIYDQFATEFDIADHGIARFALNSNSLRLKMLSDRSFEAQVVIKSFTISNMLKGNSKFREIIPAAQHDRNQVMVLYTTSSGTTPSSLAVVTVDSPQMILAFDPLFAILDFVMSPFSQGPSSANDYQVTNSQNNDQISQSSGIDFRFDLHDVVVRVLENESNADSRAIRLTIKRLSVSQQGIIALTVSNLGMSLMRMGKASEDVRFLDDVDLTFSLDNRSSSSQQVVSMEINAHPITFRASYRDINLISNIANKAVELYGISAKARPANILQSDAGTGKGVTQSQKSSRLPLRSKKSFKSVGRAHLVTTKEQLTGSFGGLRVVLIGDIHEQPMLNLRIKPFIVSVKDWTGELRATTTLATHINYWNLTNSHWEPLIDPWTFTTSVSKEGASGGTTVTLFTRERLNLNLSTTFIELALTTRNMWTQEKDRVLSQARGSYAPYRIRNHTGSPINVWSDIEGNEMKDSAPTKILNNQTVDWRFDDWKTMREHVSSAGRNSIGIQFVEQAWEQLRNVAVDREGEYTFVLRPRIDNISHRLLCEIRVQDNVKVVTLRSTYRVQNQTLYPIELSLVDDKGRPVYSLEKIAPGQDFTLPIEAVAKNRVRVQPDQGFGYRWSTPIRWEDLVAKKSFTFRCPHSDQKEAAFRFHACVQTDLSDPLSHKYPKINLKLRAPIELENLLPFDLQYRIYDKNTDQNWRSYLRKGGIMPVHSVELSHLVLLNVNIQDSPYQPSDFAIINTDGHSDYDIENSLSLRDTKNRKLQLKLNYIRYPDSGGAFKVQVYSPYLVVNKTGLPFYVKSTRSTRAGSQEVAGETNPEILSTSAPFMLSHPHERCSDFLFKVGNSMWSKLVSLEAPAAETRLVIPASSQRAEEIHIGLSWTEGLGKYKLTKVITLAPRFLIVNNMPDAVSFREHGVGPRGRSTIEPGGKCPLHFMRVGDEKLLTIAYPGLNAKWSPPINIEDIGKVAFRLSSPTADSDRLIDADVKIEGSTIFVYLSRSVNGWPFKIENYSGYKITFSQVDQRHFDHDPLVRPNPSYALLPGEEVNYAWDYPAAKEKKILLVINDAQRALDIMEIGNLVPFRFNDTKGVRAVSLDVRADGHTQVLQITNYNPELSVYRPRRRDSVSITKQESATSSQEAFEAVMEEIPPTLSLSLDLEGVGISLINKKLTEVVYISANALKFEYSSSPVAQSANLSCGSFQIDNQLHDAIYPVVLQPTPIAKESSGVASLPTIQGSVIWLNDQAHGVVFIKYCSVLLQALTIEADEDFLFSVYDLTKIQGASWDSGELDVLIQHHETIPEPQQMEAGQDLYFEVLELQPIRLTLSFVRTERVSSEDKLSIRNPLAVILNALTMAVGNVNDAPLEMNALAITDMRLTMPDLQARIIYHYRQDILRQLYRILGSADFIGNPVGLFTNVSSGVADIFYEPFNGVVMHGNKELGIGIAKGAASFVKKTVFGFSDSFTKFTSSVGKGLSAATFDSEYQNRRRIAQRRNKPRHAIYGVTSGAEALATSVASGVEGIIMKPIEGAESEGALGFFKGVGKGLVGVVTKPVVGVLDLASNLSEGIRNTTTVFDAPDRDRVRLPRSTPADGILVVYDARSAIGQNFMKDLNNGAYRTEFYVAHINLPGGDNIVLLTTSRVISFMSRKLTMEWELSFTHVQGVTIEDNGIRFAHKSGKEYDKFVYIPDKSSQAWFFGQIASVVKSFNARRRMD